MAAQSTTIGADASPKAQGENTNCHTNGNAQSPSNSAPFPVAIIGMSCRFGGDATSPSKLWDICAAGKDCWTPIPAERFDAKSLYDAKKEKPGRVG